jgi:aminoglycoside phosphotransferase (APT) family kinase protein
VHGDLNSTNLLIGAAGQAILLDWDEARRDSPLFDTAVFRPRSPVLARARLAWEVATGWRLEPDYARALATRLLDTRG